MDRDDTPGALDHELEEERASSQTGLRIGQDPGGDDCGSEEGSEDDRATAAKGLRDIADDSTADGSAGFGNDGATRGVLLREPFARLCGIMELDGAGLSGNRYVPGGTLGRHLGSCARKS